MPAPKIETPDMVPTGLADRIEAYLGDHPSNGGHSDAAGASAWELLEEALDELRLPARCDVQTEALSLQAVRADERLACWKIADKERTALKNADPDKAAWLVAFDIANAIKMRDSSPLPSAAPACTCGGDMAHDYHQDWCPAFSSTNHQGDAEPSSRVPSQQHQTDGTVSSRHQLGGE